MMRRGLILLVTIMLVITSLSVLENVHAENFYEKAIHENPGVIYTSVAIGNLDADSYEEIVAVGYSDEVNPRAYIEILEMRATGVVVDYPGTFYSANTYFYDVIIGDFDGNGINEIAVCGASYDTFTGTYSGTVKIISFYQGFSEIASYQWHSGWLKTGDAFARSITYGNISHSGVNESGIVVAYDGYDNQFNAPTNGLKVLSYDGNSLNIMAEKEYMWSGYDNVRYTDITMGDADSNGDYEILACGYYVKGNTTSYVDLYTINSTGNLTLVDTAYDAYYNCNLTVASSVLLANISGTTRIYVAEHIFDTSENKSFVGISEKAFDGQSINDVTNIFWSYSAKNAESEDLVCVDMDGDSMDELILTSNFWDNSSTAAIVTLKNMTEIYSYYPFKVGENTTFAKHMSKVWVDVDGNGYVEGILCGYFGSSSLTGYVKMIEWDELSPTIPIPQTPVDMWLNNTTVNFVWSESSDSQSGIFQYQLQIATDASFNNIIAWINTTTNNTYYTLNEGRYYWRIRAIDNAGNPSNWSVISFFGIDLTPPSAPQLQYPQNDSVINQTPILKWNSANDSLSGIKYYEVVIDDSPSFYTPIEHNYTTALNYTISTNLTQGTYYWKVRAIDNVNNIGEWSSVFHFTIAFNPPPPPELYSPTNNTWYNVSTLTFDWSDVVGQVATDHYEVEMDTNMNFTSPTKYNTTVSQITISNITDGKYYWRVRAIDVANNTGMWSDIWVFGVDTVSPTKINLTSPANSTLINKTNINFEWQSVSDLSGIKNYTFEIANNTYFINPTVVKTKQTNITLSLQSGTYYWRVRAEDNAGNVGEWSEVWKLRVDINAPAPPTLIYPADNSWISEPKPEFTWNASTDDYSGINYYEIEVDQDPNFANPIIRNVSYTTNFTPVINLSDGTYYWRVRAIDVANNTGMWSEVFVFSIDTGAPTPPTGTYPQNIILNTSYPHFSWSASLDNESGIDYYRIEVSTTQNFSVIVLSDTTTETTYNATISLPDGIYYWRVCAVDNVGNVGEWSEIYSFTIDTTPPSQPQLSSPDNGEYVSSSPQLVWNESTDAYAGVDHYEIQVSTTSDFSNIIIDDVSLSNTYTLSNLNDGTYYWRVRAVDKVNNIGEWSVIYSFTIDSIPPTTPQPITPTDGEILGVSMVDFSWSNAIDNGSGVSAYRIQIATSPDFANLVVSDSISTTYYETNLSDGTYYWRVCAVDNVGNVGEWSEIYHFTVDTTPPSIISTSPVGNAVPPTSNITVKFNENINATSAKNSITITPQISGTVIVENDTLIFIPSNDLQLGTTYSVKISGVKDIAGNVMASTYNWTFTVAAPDIEISVAVEKKNVVYVGDNITFEITLSNVGTWKAENVVLKVYKNDKVQEIPVGTIDVGSDKTEIIKIKVERKGNVTFRFVVECSYDANMANNEYSVSINVKEKPLQISIWSLLFPLLLLIIIVLLVIFFWKRKKGEVPLEEKGKEAKELASAIEKAAEKEAEKPKEKIEDIDIEELLK